MSHDPLIQEAYDVAVAILDEADNVNGIVLVCEVDDNGLVVVFDDDKLPAGPLADTLRMAADRIDGG